MKNYARKYSVNHRAFNVLSSEAIYWIGFLFADGYVSDRSVVIGLQEKDKGHLELFREFIQSNHPIRIYNNQTGYTGGKTKRAQLSIGSAYMGKRLISLGLTKKYLDRKALEIFSNSPAFWRGVIDGDGSLSAKSLGKTMTTIALSGRKTICEQFEIFVKRFIPNSKAKAHYAKKGIYAFRLACNNAKIIVRVLYEEGGPRLQRKQIIAEAIMREGMGVDRNPNIAGQKFGRLTAIKKDVEKSKSKGISYWFCVCDCGNNISAAQANLRNATTKSCGCFRAEFTAELNRTKRKISSDQIACNLLRSSNSTDSMLSSPTPS